MIARLWMRIRQATSFLVLLGVWALVITPIALLSRLIRGDVLGQPDPDVPSYWEAPDAPDDDELVAFFTRSGKLWLLPVVLLILALGVLLLLSESTLAIAFLYPLS